MLLMTSSDVPGLLIQAGTSSLWFLDHPCLHPQLTACSFERWSIGPHSLESPGSSLFPGAIRQLKIHPKKPEGFSISALTMEGAHRSEKLPLLAAE